MTDTHATNIFCFLFGHQPPIYAKKGWFSPGEEYAKEIRVGPTDGIGRVHAAIVSACPRCGYKFTLCRIHLPPS